MDRKRVATYVLIGSLVFVFGWFGIDKFRDPYFWSTYLPDWMEGLMNIPGTSWVVVIGLFELLLALLLLIPIRRLRRVAVTLMILHLIGILWQVGWNDIGVRDIGLAMSAAALLILL